MEFHFLAKKVGRLIWGYEKNIYIFKNLFKNGQMFIKCIALASIKKICPPKQIL